MNYPIRKTPDGIPVIPIGGGAFTKTFHFRIVLTKNKELKPAIFIRSAGTLSTQLDQGITPIQTGDLIVTGSGQLPIDPANPDISIRGYRVSTMMTDDYAIVFDEHITIAEIPECVKIGAQIYHNRDGSYFSGSGKK